MSLAFRKSGLEDDDREAVARFCEVKDFGPSLTSQSHADEVNINKIIARVQKGQQVLTSSGTPFYGDVSHLSGLQDAIIKAQEAEELFMQYPAEVREKFQNDPVQMVSFLEDDRNLEEAIKLGLVVKRPRQDLSPVPEPVNTPPPAPAEGK